MARMFWGFLVLVSIEAGKQLRKRCYNMNYSLRKGLFMSRKKLPIILEPKEIQKLLDQPSKKSLIGLRNLAIMKTMLNLGLRVSEITNLKESEIDLGTEKLRITQGKGGKDRDLAIPEASGAILKEWDKQRPRSLYFFSNLKGGQLLTRYLQEAIPRYAQKAGIKKRVYCHLLRHIFATNFYRQTKDIETLKLILGHSWLSTTQIYITLANVEVEQSMKAFVGF